MKKAVGALVLFALAPALRAQDTGSITGKVADRTGAVLPGVAVVATGAATGVATQTVTAEERLLEAAAYWWELNEPTELARTLSNLAAAVQAAGRHK